MADVNITLTDAEAQTLRALLQYIGGSSKYSPRGHADNVDRKLEAAGVPKSGEQSSCLQFHQCGSVRFENYENVRASDAIRTWEVPVTTGLEAETLPMTLDNLEDLLTRAAAEGIRIAKQETDGDCTDAGIAVKVLQEAGLMFPFDVEAGN